MLLFVVQLVALRKVGIIARDVVNYWAFVVAFAMIDFSPPMSAALQLRYRIHARDYCWLRVTRCRGELLQRRHDGSSHLAPLENRLTMLLKGVQARLQSMKHRDGAIGLLSGLS
jgi:hypothetical protein